MMRPFQLHHMYMWDWPRTMKGSFVLYCKRGIPLCLPLAFNNHSKTKELVPKTDYLYTLPEVVSSLQIHLFIR